MARESSLTERAYIQLRDGLLSCRLKPGERINIKEVSAAMGVSLGAAREALSRLTSEGLVLADASRGFRAAEISAEDLRDLVGVRVDIESQCLRRAIALGDDAWEAGVVEAADRLGGIPVRGRGETRLSDDYAQAHAHFHAALVSACDSPWLLRIRALLYVQSERYRYLTVPLASGERDIGHEHDSLVRAVLARDAEEAVRVLQAHLSRTADILLETANGDRFAPKRSAVG